MVNGAFNHLAGPCYFALKRFDALFQLGNGKRTQILSEQLGQRIISPAGKIVVHVHNANVDRLSQSVNKALIPFTESGGRTGFWGQPLWRLKKDFRLR